MKSPGQQFYLRQTIGCTSAGLKKKMTTVALVLVLALAQTPQDAAIAILAQHRQFLTVWPPLCTSGNIPARLSLPL